MNIMESLEAVGAVYDGYHFVYKSGKHGQAYISPDGIFPYLPAIPELGSALAEPFRDNEVAVVMGPAFGGNYLALLAAVALSSPARQVLWLATRKEGADNFIVEPDRGFEAFLRPGTKVLLVEDLLTTGGSVLRLAAMLIRVYGVEVVGVSVVVNRGGVTAGTLGVQRLAAVANVDLGATDPEACRLCHDLDGHPIVVDPGLGHGAAYRREHPHMPDRYFVSLLKTHSS